MPFKDKTRQREYHREYLRKWKEKNPGKYKEYLKKHRQKKDVKERHKDYMKQKWQEEKDNRPDQICERCGAKFRGRLNQKKCNDCRYIPGRKKKCLSCNSEFIPKGQQKYCSQDCVPLKEKPLRRKQCYHCQGEFVIKANNQKYCSRKCYDNSPKMREFRNKWARTTPKGIISSIVKRENREKKCLNGWDERDSKVIEKIKKRDKVCVYCQNQFDQTEKRKESFDHFNPSKPFSLENGVRCCKSCNSSKGSLPPKNLIGWIRRNKFNPSQIVYELLIKELRTIQDKDTTYSNLWLFRKSSEITRNGNNKRMFEEAEEGNKFSKFNPIVAENIINFWSREDDLILDPFAGRIRPLVAGLKNRMYLGFDTLKRTVDQLNQVIDKNKNLFKFTPKVICDDAINVNNYLNTKADFIFSCPPYWNLEKYDSCDGQLSDIQDYSKFISELKARIKENYGLLKDGGYAAFVIGDFRRNGELIPFHSDFIQLAKEVGFCLHDIVVLQTVSWNLANLRFGSMKNSKITSKVCEYLIVFKKLY